jgi:hypothetical protein
MRSFCRYVENDLTVLDELTRHASRRIHLDRQIGCIALIRTPFMNGADQIRLG